MTPWPLYGAVVGTAFIAFALLGRRLRRLRPDDGNDGLDDEVTAG